MKVVMISDWETQYGGAAISASRLAKKIVYHNHELTRIVSSSDHSKHPWNVFQVRPFYGSNFIRSYMPKFIKKYLFECRSKYLFNIFLKELSPDVIHLHNIHGAIGLGWSHKLIQLFSSFAPVVWTLHDMWSITGRCAFSNDCSLYVNGCDDRCPTPEEYPALEPSLIRREWDSRKELFSSLPGLIAISPSKWLANLAKGGMWSQHRVEVIPNGIPLDAFYPINRIKARNQLGINNANYMILLVAHDFSDTRKGLRLLNQALQIVERSKITLLIMGGNSSLIGLADQEVFDFGYVNEDNKKALIYSAADIFIHPALADNLPNTILESIGCGTPVVGFNVGGIPEVVRPGLTGWLVDELTPVSLASTLQLALGEISRGLNLNNSCRSIAEIEYGDNLQSERYIKLFKTLL